MLPTGSKGSNSGTQAIFSSFMRGRRFGNRPGFRRKNGHAPDLAECHNRRMPVQMSPVTNRLPVRPERDNNNGSGAQVSFSTLQRLDIRLTSGLQTLALHARLGCEIKMYPKND